MAKKPHKYAADRLELETRLSVASLGEICDLAAVESTGDHWHGKMKVLGRGWKDGVQYYDVKGGLLYKFAYMLLTVRAQDSGNHATLSTHIVEYTTVQTKTSGVIPVGPKRMVAHHVYMQFIEKIANTVSENDPSAWCYIRAAKLNLEPPPKPQWTAVAGSAPGGTSNSAPQPRATEQPSVVVPDEAVADDEGVPEVVVAALPREATAPEPESSTPSDGVAIELSEEEFDEQTRVVPRRRAARGWRLLWGAGEDLELSGAVVFGREPEPPRDVPEAAVRSVGALETTVSKTHALVRIESGSLVVTDLGSTNGTRIVTPDGDVIDCPTGVPTAASAGSEIELGSFVIQVVDLTEDRS